MPERFLVRPSQRRAGFWELVDQQRSRFARFVRQESALSAALMSQPRQDALIWRDLKTGHVIAECGDSGCEPGCRHECPACRMGLVTHLACDPRCESGDLSNGSGEQASKPDSPTSTLEPR